MSRLRQILLIILFIILAIAIGILIFYFFLRPTPPKEVVTPPEVIPPVSLPEVPQAEIPGVNIAPEILPPTEPGVTPEEELVTPTELAISPRAEGGLTTPYFVTENQIKNPTLAPNSEDLIFYDQDLGLFYRITPTGEKTLLTEKIFKNVENITWSNNGQKAVIEYPDRTKIIFDFNTKKQYTLPREWEEFSFSPSDNQIAFKELNFDFEQRWLSVANVDGTGKSRIEHLGDNDDDVIINWQPNNQSVGVVRKSVDLNQTQLEMIGLHGENFNPIIAEGRDPRITYSSDGKLMAYSVYNSQSGFMPSLWIVASEGDGVGTNRRLITLNTWADKCTWAPNTYELYCAVPQKMEAGAALFPEISGTNIADDIYKINPANGSVSLIAEPFLNSGLTNLIVSEDGNTLYYLDSQSEQLKKINL